MFEPPANDLTSDAFARETPVFAASADFAWTHGGPLMRSFLEAVTAQWPAERLVLDATLVWLRPGLSAGDPLWHREPYPREHRGAFGAANAEWAVQHAACVHGEPALPEVLQASPLLADLPEVMVAGMWHAPTHERRSALIDDAIAQGQLRPEPFQRGAIHRYDGAAFVREGRATGSGFRWWMRATLGSARPWANGLRNVSTVHR